MSNNLTRKLNNEVTNDIPDGYLRCCSCISLSKDNNLVLDYEDMCYADQLHYAVHNATVDIQESIKNLTSHIESIKMSKANKEYLDKEIKNIQNLFKSKIPYMVKRFNEQLEESVGEAKTEISAFINQLVNQQENKLIQNEIKQKLIDNNL